MPPDPVLALLAFVGLFAYTVIGAAVAAPTMRLLFPTLHEHLSGRNPNYRYPGETWVAVGVITALWPAAFPAVVVAYAGRLLLGLAKRTSTYVAQIGR